MVDDRTPAKERELRQKILRRFVDERIARPRRAVAIETVEHWFPVHERDAAMAALMRLVADSGPVQYATRGETVWLADVTDGMELLDELETDYPHWFDR